MFCFAAAPKKFFLAVTKNNSLHLVAFFARAHRDGRVPLLTLLQVAPSLSIIMMIILICYAHHGFDVANKPEVESYTGSFGKTCRMFAVARKGSWIENCVAALDKLHET